MFTAIREKKKQVDNESNNKSSWDFAANLNRCCITYTIITIVPNRNIAPLNKAIRNIAGLIFSMIDMVDNANTAKTSSSKSMPIIILACNVSSSFLSDNNFTTTIVDENVTTSARYIISMLLKPRK